MLVYENTTRVFWHLTCKHSLSLSAYDPRYKAQDKHRIEMASEDNRMEQEQVLGK